MTRLVVDAHDPEQQALAAAATVLREGGVVAYPTETFYGLAVDPGSDAAVRRLFDLKERDRRSPITLVAADQSQAERAGTFGPSERRLAAAFWPGPLTIVVPATRVLSSSLTSGRSVGIRVPGHPLARALARTFGSCVTATSANLSGGAPAATASEVAAALESRIDLLIDAGPTPGGAPSTIVEMIEGVLTLHRPGAVAWNRVLESLQ